MRDVRDDGDQVRAVGLEETMLVAPCILLAYVEVRRPAGQPGREEGVRMEVDAIARNMAASSSDGFMYQKLTGLRLPDYPCIAAKLLDTSSDAPQEEQDANRQTEKVEHGHAGFKEMKTLYQRSWRGATATSSRSGSY